MKEHVKSNTNLHVVNKKKKKKPRKRILIINRKLCLVFFFYVLNIKKKRKRRSLQEIKIMMSVVGWSRKNNNIRSFNIRSFEDFYQKN